MSYVIDRERALYTEDLVAIVKGQRPRARSLLVLRDNSLHETLTRPQTLMRCAEDQPGAIVQIGSGKRKGRARRFQRNRARGPRL